MPAIIDVKGVCKSFGGLKANKDITISVEEGSIYGLIGPNGAGKTTFLNCILGTLCPEEGKIFYNGTDITGYKPYRIAQLGISRTFQIVKSLPEFTAVENVMVGGIFANHQPRETARANALKNLEFVGFTQSTDTLAKNLNTVQLKKLELARALTSNCKVLILDEVAAGLTPSELNEITILIKKIRDSLGVTIIIVEHLMKLIMDVCDKIAVLYFGELLAEGIPNEIVADEKVIKAYLGDNYML